MEFCIISPTAGLERYATLSKTHLVLAHVHDEVYEKFYINRRQAGDFIILDNGAYEGMELSSDTLRAAMIDYQPNVMTLPDFLLQPWQKTWHAAMAFLDKYYNEFPEVEWLYIPQSEKGDLHGFMESYQEAVSDPRIAWLGIPRALAYAITSNPLMRVEFARMVHTEHPRIKLHAFGMVNGDVHELHYLDGLVNSIDSSAPVWRGWNCNAISDPQDRMEWDATGTPVEFNAQLSEDPADAMIIANLKECNVRIPTRK